MGTTPPTTLFRCTAMTVSSRNRHFSLVFTVCLAISSIILLGEYHVLGAIWFQTPEQSVRSLFHDPPGSHRLKLGSGWILYKRDYIFRSRLATLGIFFVIYYLLCCWTYGKPISSSINIFTRLRLNVLVCLEPF